MRIIFTIVLIFYSSFIIAEILVDENELNKIPQTSSTPILKFEYQKPLQKIKPFFLDESKNINKLSHDNKLNRLAGQNIVCSKKIGDINYMLGFEFRYDEKVEIFKQSNFNSSSLVCSYNVSASNIETCTTPLDISKTSSSEVISNYSSYYKSKYNINRSTLEINDFLLNDFFDFTGEQCELTENRVLTAFDNFLIEVNEKNLL